MCRPTQSPAPAETTWESENAPVTATADQPVCSEIEDCRAAKA